MSIGPKASWCLAGLAGLACLWLGLSQQQMQRQVAMQTLDNQALLHELKSLRRMERPASQQVGDLDAQIESAVQRALSRSRVPTNPSTESEPAPAPEPDAWEPVRQEAIAFGRQTLDDVLADGRLTRQHSESLGEALRAMDGPTRHAMMRELSNAINAEQLDLEDPAVLELL